MKNLKADFTSISLNHNEVVKIGKDTYRCGCGMIFSSEEALLFDKAGQKVYNERYAEEINCPWCYADQLIYKITEKLAEAALTDKKLPHDIMDDLALYHAHQGADISCEDEFPNLSLLMK